MARLGELLIRENVISLQQLQQAQEEQKRSGERLGSSLISLGIMGENELLKFLAKHYNVPAVELATKEIPPEVISLLTEEVVVKHQVMPVDKKGTTLVLAMTDPSNIFAIDDIKFLTGYNIEVAVATETQIKEAIEKYYKQSAMQISYEEVLQDFDEDEIAYMSVEEALSEIDLEKSAEEAPVVKLVNLIMLDAIKKGASDIHIEIYENQFRVRYRLDGQLYEVIKPPLKLHSAVLSRIKIMSSLDIAERRLPQDGRIKLKLGKGREMDFRVSVLPTLFGEKAVLRLLDKSNLQLDMSKLGFEVEALKIFQHNIHQPYGIVLVTGPTGSGKTTTLYSALTELNKVTENISTAEDPVEYNLLGINQVQMHEEIGLNFAAALRAFLRQDPDIIMVGEIRDFETAEIAIKAALTGHLVLSTLHTNDAPSTIFRMLNMGIEPFLIAASLNAIVAQRLVRTICSNCKAPFQLSEAALKELQVPPEYFGKFQPYKGKGCDKCSKTGYKGRIAIYEVMPCNETVKDLIINGASALELKNAVIQGGMKSLRQAAITKFIEGLTTFEEVGRVTAMD